MALRLAIMARAARNTRIGHKLSDANDSANIWSTASIRRTPSRKLQASDQEGIPIMSPFRRTFRRRIRFSVLKLLLSDRRVPDCLRLFLGAAEWLVCAPRLAVCIVRHVRHPAPPISDAVPSKHHLGPSSELPNSAIVLDGRLPAGLGLSSHCHRCPERYPVPSSVLN